jgi:hypothetical protein
VICNALLSPHMTTVKNTPLNNILFIHVIYKACSKKDRTYAIKTLLLILQHSKHCPLQSSPLYWRYTVPNFYPLLECFLERTFCDGEQFSYRSFLNLLYGLETTSFQSGFKFGKQEKSVGPENILNSTLLNDALSSLD